MEVDQQIAEILGSAETKLNELVAEALRQRDYTAVQRVSGVAGRVAAAADNSRFVANRPANGTSASHSPMENREQSPGAAAEEHFQKIPAVVSLKEAIPAAPGSVAEVRPFPRFYRSDRELIKIGYSKTDRRTYEHRSPHELLDRLVEVVADLGADGRRFTTDRILPPHDARLADVPSYQVYLCLAFLVLRGLVKKHGRSGYTIAAEHSVDLSAAVDAKWKELSIR